MGFKNNAKPITSILPGLLPITVLHLPATGIEV